MNATDRPFPLSPVSILLNMVVSADSVPRSDDAAAMKEFLTDLCKRSVIVPLQKHGAGEVDLAVYDGRYRAGELHVTHLEAKPTLANP